MKIIYILFLSPLLLILSLPKATASISSGDKWTIQVDEVNITSDIPTISTPKKELTTEEEADDISDRINSHSPFSLNISNSIVDYGILSATNPIYRTTNIAVSNPKNKFIVTMDQDHPLAIKGSATIIADSTCDNGSCSEITPALWENTLTYGLGYRCDDVIGKNCPIDLKLNNYYKQFSDYSKNESPQIIMSNNSRDEIHETQITYKVNISKSQPAGSYTNIITYIASPGY